VMHTGSQKGPVRDEGVLMCPGRSLCNNHVSDGLPLNSRTGQPGEKKPDDQPDHPVHRVQWYNLKDHTNLKPLRKQKLNYD